MARRLRGLWRWWRGYWDSGIAGDGSARAALIKVVVGEKPCVVVVACGQAPTGGNTAKWIWEIHWIMLSLVSFHECYKHIESIPFGRASLSGHKAFNFLQSCLVISFCFDRTNFHWIRFLRSSDLGEGQRLAARIHRTDH